MKKEIIERAKVWLGPDYDEETRRQVQNMLDNDPNELTESFYRNLEFGTGGLRGIMGAGTNRMNIYTVAMATQGLANYIKMMFPKKKTPQVAIGYDCRNNSAIFAKTTADVMTANGIKVFMFKALRPTPELSFAIRKLQCQAGVVVTASHNPKEYNGYKAYWSDGGQLVNPHDINVIAEVNKIESIAQVNRKANDKLLEYLDESFDDIYLAEVAKLSLSPKAIENQKDLRFVYTPIHGTGGQVIPKFLAKIGFKNVYTVEEQMVVDGNFPTVVSPNPEEPAAMNLAIQKAKKVDADIVLATDPDADRVGVAVKNDQGEFILLNGNQTASLLTYYILTRWGELGKYTGKEYVIKTVVTTNLIFDIADKYKVGKAEVLTGFKFIADKILNKPDEKFICGGEESYGFLVSDFVRDKDSVIAVFMLAEAAAWAAEQGKTLYTILKEMYVEFGLYKEKLLSLTKKGIKGGEEIREMMKNFRSCPPKDILGSPVREIRDYKLSICRDMEFGVETIINQPKSDVLQYIAEDGTIVSIRPSGTEPKIKFYFSTKEPLKYTSDFERVEKEVDAKLSKLVEIYNK